MGGRDRRDAPLLARLLPTSHQFYGVTSCTCVVWVLSAAKPVSVSSKSKKSKPPGAKKGPKGHKGTTAASHTYDKVGTQSHKYKYTNTEKTRKAHTQSTWHIRTPCSCLMPWGNEIEMGG